jgi:hypothetical protein
VLAINESVCPRSTACRVVAPTGFEPRSNSEQICRRQLNTDHGAARPKPDQISVAVDKIKRSAFCLVTPDEDRQMYKIPRCPCAEAIRSAEQVRNQLDLSTQPINDGEV